MIAYGKKAPLIGLIHWDRRWCVGTGSLRVSSPRWYYARGLCEAARTGGSGGVARVAREFGFAGFGRAKTALGETVSTGFALEEATCRIIWFDVVILRREHRTTLYRS